jgi:hypothetical protein
MEIGTILKIVQIRHRKIRKNHKNKRVFKKELKNKIPLKHSLINSINHLNMLSQY